MLRARALPLHTLPSTQSLARTQKSAAACAAPDPHWAAAAVAICAHPIERQRKHLPPETLPLRRARNVPAQAHTRCLILASARGARARAYKRRSSAWERRASGWLKERVKNIARK